MNLREEIIKTAYELFLENGYDKTSVAQIISAVGSSKGGFYHHFKSKDDILEEITLSYVDTIKEFYNEILASQTQTVVEKFEASYFKISEFKKESIKDWPKLKRLFEFKGNHLLFFKMSEAFQRETELFYRNLIIEGNHKKVFSVSYPNQLAALWSREVIQFHRTARKAFLGDTEKESEFRETLKFNEDLINHLLGLETCSIKLEKLGIDFLESMKDSISKLDITLK